MKSGFSGALLAGAILSNAAATEGVAQLPLALAQTEASPWVARIVDRYRYKSEGQPDGIGARPLDRFVEALDADHMVFTRIDLASMAGQRAELDKLVNEKQMEIPNAIFATYVTRSIALHVHAQEILAQPLNFNGHERFQRVRARAGWEADDAALRDLWRRRVMDDYLNLRLAGKAESEIVPTLRQRYDRNLQRVRAMRSEDVANLFLNAYVEYRDPHGAYLGPQKTPSGQTPVDEVGIGLVLQKNEDLATVREVAAGSPADRSAIGPGDRIVGVEQVAGQPAMDVIGWRVDEVIALLRGVAGSQVALDILPQGVVRGSVPRRVVLTRAKVQIDEQRARGRIEVIARSGIAYRIGVIAVPTFYQDFAARRAGAKDYSSVTRDVAGALEQMKVQKADAVLLDMRSNGGGSLTEAIDLTGLFLPGVPIVQQVTTERQVTVERTPARTPAWDGPLAILIGRQSAAATEILAAAIQDYGRGLIIGDVSYGRGSVQTLISLDRFSKDPAKRYGDLKLTVAVLCRAGGKPIQPAGVTPDIVTPGRIDVTGKANADLFAGAACRTQDIPKSANVSALLPTLTGLHASRMQANRSYQAHLARRAQEEALLSSDEVALNDAERRRTGAAKPEGEIAHLQLQEALSVLGDAVEQMRKSPVSTGGKP